VINAKCAKCALTQFLSKFIVTESTEFHSSHALSIGIIATGKAVLRYLLSIRNGYFIYFVLCPLLFTLSNPNSNIPLQN
jgi:hypothetical protein